MADSEDPLAGANAGVSARSVGPGGDADGRGVLRPWALVRGIYKLLYFNDYSSAMTFA